MEFFWDDVPELVGKRIDRVRYTSLATTAGDSLVVIACEDGTVVRLRCTELGCEVDDILPGEPE
jgi:hypothetical protein